MRQEGENDEINDTRKFPRAEGQNKRTINLKRFLRENSYWYKILNRNENAYRIYLS